MRPFVIVARVVGLSQLALAALYLFAPIRFVTWQGLTPPAADACYPLAMLGARFLVYGVGMFILATDPRRHLFWARGMIVIQLLDLAAGAVYVATGAVAAGDAALPMVNASLFAAALALTLPGALRHAAPAGPVA